MAEQIKVPRIIDPSTGRPYPLNETAPPPSPQIRDSSLRGANETDPRDTKDTARYLVDPDDEFARPYLAVPGGRAFIWPLPTQGFEITDQAELGRHKYIGDMRVDVDVTHKGDTTIVLSGVFPGWTSTETMAALRQVFYADTPSTGKVLYLPGVLETLYLVAGESLRFAHDVEERSMDILYTATFVRTRIGGSAIPLGSTQPDDGARSGGSTRTSRTFKVTATVNTLRKIATVVFKNAERWVDLYGIRDNADIFEKAGVPTHQIPDYRLPPGTSIYY